MKRKVDPLAGWPVGPFMGRRIAFLRHRATGKRVHGPTNKSDEKHLEQSLISLQPININEEET
jgi:hypothetical protein